MEHPRVNPTDWATRRKDAMNRARELRSKMKEQENTQDIPDELQASKTDLQRQRRSRQLEETQRLLDGHSDDFNQVEASGRISYKEKHESVRTESNEQHRMNNDQQKKTTVSSVKNNGSIETHGIISREKLAHIHQQHKNLDYIDESDMEIRQNSDMKDGASKRVVKQKEASASDSASFRAGNEIKVGDLHERLFLERDNSSSLREKPFEGRGRGRGRGKSTFSSNSSPSFSDTSHFKSVPQSSNARIRETSPTYDRTNADELSARIRSSSSALPPPTKTKSRSLASFIFTYLSERQIPDYKEGECEKLALLRQKMVARREKRKQIHLKAKVIDEKNEKGYSFNTKVIHHEKETIQDSLPHSSHHVDTRQLDVLIKAGKKHESQMDKRTTHILNSAHLEESMSIDRSQSSNVKNNQGNDSVDDDDAVVKIELITCDRCKRSFAPKVYEKHFDSDGQPKCASQSKKRRPVFNAAKVRIANNDALSKDEQMQVLKVQKEVAKELAKKSKSGGIPKKSKRNSKWREQSNGLREAMKANRLITKAEREGKPAHYYL